MPKILSTNILDFVVNNRENLMHLQTKSAAVSSFVQDSKMAAEAAVFVIDQQSAVISELRLALNQSMKVAAALAEAAVLAKDGMIDSADVLNHARRALDVGTVKVSSLNEIFDHSPGQITGNVSNQTAQAGALDPLTSALRSFGTSAI